MSRPKIIFAACLVAACAAAGVASAAPRMIDLLPYIDPQQDAVRGQWKMTPEGISLAKPEDKKSGMLELPYEPPEEYDFLIEFTPQSGGYDVAQCVYAGGRSFAWVLNRGGTKPPLYGFELFDGKTPEKELTETAVRKPKFLEKGKRYTSLVEVRRGSLRALVDGEEYVKWSGDFHRLRMFIRLLLRDDHRLGIGSLTRAVVFHRVAVREISGPGKLTRTEGGAKIQLNAKPEELTNSIGMKLTRIPAGECLMGANEREIAGFKERIRRDVENAPKLVAAQIAKGKTATVESTLSSLKRALENIESMGPQHRVIITKPFCLGTYLVTQKEFAAVMGFNPSRFSARGQFKDKVAGINTGRFPVEGVSWETAVEFCRQLSALPEEVAAGRTYRLPTEAEWEYACRAGTNTLRFWDNFGTWEDYAWLAPNGNNQPHPVGEKRPNPWGLFDMLGNIAVWCADWYDPQAYAAAPLRDPTGPASGTERVSRGTWSLPSYAVATSVGRDRAAPQMAGWIRGIRVACDVSSAAPPAAEALPEPPAAHDAESHLKQKGLTRRMGYLPLPAESQFIRYCTTIERLRVACFHAQKEYQDANRQVSRANTAQAGVVKARMQARSAIGYSETWREHWAAVRATNQASDAVLLAGLSKDDAQQWCKDAQDDLNSAVELFGQQIDKLQKMYQKLQADYAKLYEDKTVKHALADMNSQGKTTYRIGPTPSAAAAMKKLEHEQGLLAQFKK